MADALPSWKADFLQHCIDSDVLRFGTFELKSKRISPYFFNAGLFHRADLLRSISTSYARTIHTFVTSQPSSSPFEFDVLFGPAYKGIPLATAATEKLAGLDESRYGQLSYSFNRKEAKDHGEGGNIVGAPLNGRRVVIVDDVITAGTAIREAIDIIEKEGGTLVGIVVALDRMEKVPAARKEDDDDGLPRSSAIGEVRKKYGVPVLSILTLDDIIEGLSRIGSEEDVRRLGEYRKRYRPSE
ncbi:MAG: Nucleolar GTP-binding protein 1 [Chaenotheca gracillima]|nr:MAG: Nucleolar GTP-binding protein 1 [Chaenotheca gracillima]